MLSLLTVRSPTVICVVCVSSAHRLAMICSTGHPFSPSHHPFFFQRMWFR